MSGPDPGALPGPGGVPQRAPVPANGRGVIALVEQNCTVCMICVRECPDWCIYVEGHQESRTEPGARARSHNVLDRFAIDFSLCMYCGICVEVCPFDALHWSPEHDYAVAAALDLTHEKERLGAWESTVPARTVAGEHPDSGAPEATADRS